MSWKEIKAEIKKTKDANRALTEKYRDELKEYNAQTRAHEEWTRLPEEEKTETAEPAVPDEPLEPKLAPLPDWRNTWKYGNKIRGIGNCAGQPCIDWGPDITFDEMELIEALVTSPHKWAERVERILDNPPTKEDLELLKRIKPLL